MAKQSKLSKACVLWQSNARVLLARQSSCPLGKAKLSEAKRERQTRAGESWSFSDVCNMICNYAMNMLCNSAMIYIISVRNLLGRHRFTSTETKYLAKPKLESTVLTEALCFSFFF